MESFLSDFVAIPLLTKLYAFILQTSLLKVTCLTKKYPGKHLLDLQEYWRCLQCSDFSSSKMSLRNLSGKRRNCYDFVNICLWSLFVCRYCGNNHLMRKGLKKQVRHSKLQYSVYWRPIILVKRAIQFTSSLIQCCYLISWNYNSTSCIDLTGLRREPSRKTRFQT